MFEYDSYLKADRLRKQIRQVCAIDLLRWRRDGWETRKKLEIGLINLQEYISQIAFIKTRIYIVKDYAKHIDGNLSFLRQVAARKEEIA